MSELLCSLRRRIPAGAVPALCFLLYAWPAQPQMITTIAGNGVAAFSGDGGLASSASLNHPLGMAVVAGGPVYIADTDNWRIREVSASGMISTVGGTGLQGFSGDGGPAVNAAFSDVTGVVLDNAGNLYVGDASNRRVRKISPSGIVTTVAGIGIEGFSGDGGPATSARLGRPQSLAIDSAGNLYIADSTNQRIRKIAVNGTITTIAGNGQQGFSGDGGAAVNASLQFPVGVAVDSAGNVYVADGNNNRIRKISPSGIISTLAGNGSGVRFSGDGGLAVNATLDVPSDVAVDAAGNVYIADAGNNRVRKVDTSGVITTVAGTGTDGFSGDGGTATQATLNFPWGLTTDASGNVYVADRVNDRVRKIGLSLPSVAPTLNAVVNGASFSASMAVAPGSAVSIFGTNLAGTTLMASSTSLPIVLGDTSVSFNGTAAPLYYVSSTQVNAQVPFDLAVGTINVQVRRGSMISATMTVHVGAFSPGIFTDQAGTGAILHAGNFSVVSAGAPARVGEFILIFATGLGSLRTPFPSGTPAPSNPPADTLITPIVTIGGLSATVGFSGLAPGFVGLYQLNVQVPASLASGNQPVQILAGGLVSNTATVAVTR